MAGKNKHRPLAHALKTFSGPSHRDTLANILLTVRRATESSEFLRELLESRKLFRPLAWSPEKAWRFLKDVPVYEDAGIVVRIPDWWRARNKRRPQVRVSVGAPSGELSLHGLLEFDQVLALDGEVLTQQERDKLLSASEGLVNIRGQWVEADGERLQAIMEHWQNVQARAERGELGFIEGMRLLAGASDDGRSLEQFDRSEVANWTSIHPSDSLRTMLQGLQHPSELLDDVSIPDPFQSILRSYQAEGFRWLALASRLKLGVCLADDMGLGKTVQMLTLIEHTKKALGPSSDVAPTHLAVVPASLLANWLEEIDKFAPALRVFVAHSSFESRDDIENLSAEDLTEVDLVLTSYGHVRSYGSFSDITWHHVILDEAQAIKNPATKQTRAIKNLSSHSRFALTGTPVENRLGDLWSLFDFLAPGLLGSAQKFNEFTDRMTQTDPPDFAPLRKLVSPFILRRSKTDERIAADLPDKIEMHAFCSLTKRQAALYEESVEALRSELEEREGMERRGIIFSYMMRFKQICNHPSQWLGDGAYEPADSGKFQRMKELCEEISERQEKVLVFTQFREMIEPLSGFLREIFSSRGVVLHGGTPVAKRQARVRAFQEDPSVAFFLLSLKAGGTGLNLTSANHVVHFDRWWNPAVEDQATDRAYRIGQEKNVLVHKFVCRGTIEERIDRMIESKKRVAREVLSDTGEPALTELSSEELMELVTLDVDRAVAGS